MEHCYTFSPTAEEWRRGLELTRVRRSSKSSDIVKTVILGLLILYCWIPFFLSQSRDWSVFLTGLAALVLGAAIWAVPALTVGRDARRIAAEKKSIRLTVDRETLGFGEGERFSALPYDQIRAHREKELLTLSFEGGSMLVVPRRCVSAEDWELMNACLSGGKGKGHDGTKKIP